MVRNDQTNFPWWPILDLKILEDLPTLSPGFNLNIVDDFETETSWLGLCRAVWISSGLFPGNAANFLSFTVLHVLKNLLCVIIM